MRLLILVATLLLGAAPQEKDPWKAETPEGIKAAHHTLTATAAARGPGVLWTEAPVEPFFVDTGWKIENAGNHPGRLVLELSESKSGRLLYFEEIRRFHGGDIFRGSFRRSFTFRNTAAGDTVRIRFVAEIQRGPGAEVSLEKPRIARLGRTPKEAVEIDRLITDLGAGEIEARELAMKELDGMGCRAMEPVRKAAESDDVEVAGRARTMIQNAGTVVTPAVIDLKAASPEWKMVERPGLMRTPAPGWVDIEAGKRADRPLDLSFEKSMENFDFNAELEGQTFDSGHIVIKAQLVDAASGASLFEEEILGLVG